MFRHNLLRILFLILLGSNFLFCSCTSKEKKEEQVSSKNEQVDKSNNDSLNEESADEETGTDSTVTDSEE